MAGHTEYVARLQSRDRNGREVSCSRGTSESGQVNPIELEIGVEFRDVSFRYDKEDRNFVLNGIELFIKARETTAILGPSGGGKSTFADLLIGLLTPDKGQVLIDGKRLEGNILHSWRRSVGYVPQESLLFHDTLQDNMRWASPESSEEDIWKALKLAAAMDFVKALPEGLKTVVGDRGVRLSGGQRQRIALARALSVNLLCCCWTKQRAIWTQKTSERIIQALQELRGTMTVVFISHRQSAVRMLGQSRGNRRRPGARVTVMFGTSRTVFYPPV